MANLAVFASGRGSNFVALAAHLSGHARHRLAVLVCDVPGARVLYRAREAGVPVRLVSYRGRERAAAEMEMLAVMGEHGIDAVALAGFMRLLTPHFLSGFSGPVLNLHPSLLPKYPGTHGIEESFRSADRELGISVIRVDEGVDTGPVLLQRSFERAGTETLEQIERRIHDLEHVWFPVAVLQALDALDAGEDLMNVLVLGSGAREHALAWKLGASARVTRVFAGPGNTGTSNAAENLPGVDPMRADTVATACRERRIDCVFIGPEAPLAAGVADALRAEGIATIGPGRKAARLESSKAFSKAFLVRNGIPTAEAAAFRDADGVRAHLASRRGQRLVVKKSGLAAGKGVLVSADHDELAAFAAAAVRDDEVLIEECLEGWEVSVFGLSDGTDHLVLPPCTDFKRAHDGDEGPNTGGMGSICPVPPADSAFMARVKVDLVRPVYAALAREGLAYPGVLYFGLMVTATGPKVLEFNVRFGDPETQVLLPVLDADLGELCEAMATGSLGRFTVDAVARPRGAALGVVVASRGYPERSANSVPVDPIAPPPPGEALVFHASTGRDTAGRVVTGGGRCFTVVGLGADLAEASRRAYAAVGAVKFDGAWHRGDIGARFTRAGAAGPAPNPRASGGRS